MLVVLLVAVDVIYLKNHKRAKAILAQIAAGLLLHFAITEGVLKHFLYRLRPYLKFPDLIHPYGQAFTDSSWPSSHLVITTLFTLIILQYFPKKWPFGAIVISLMLLSRIYNGMHFLSDTLSGIVIGVIYFLAVRFIFKEWAVRQTFKSHF